MTLSTVLRKSLYKQRSRARPLALRWGPALMRSSGGGHLRESGAERGWLDSEGNGAWGPLVAPRCHARDAAGAPRFCSRAGAANVPLQAGKRRVTIPPRRHAILARCTMPISRRWRAILCGSQRLKGSQGSLGEGGGVLRRLRQAGARSSLAARSCVRRLAHRRPSLAILGQTTSSCGGAVRLWISCPNLARHSACRKFKGFGGAYELRDGYEVRPLGLLESKEAVARHPRCRFWAPIGNPQNWP